MKYAYFVAGRWRNHQAIREVLDQIRAAGKSVYCFVDNAYKGDGINIGSHRVSDVEKFMSELEAVGDWRENPTFRTIYENDMNGLKESAEFVMVFPAGLSAHMELGVAYGLGKKCYGIGAPEKNETLYLMFDEIYPDVQSFLEAKVGVAA